MRWFTLSRRAVISATVFSRNGRGSAGGSGGNGRPVGRRGSAGGNGSKADRRSAGGIDRVRLGGPSVCRGSAGG